MQQPLAMGTLRFRLRCNHCVACNAAKHNRESIRSVSSRDRFGGLPWPQGGRLRAHFPFLEAPCRSAAAIIGTRAASRSQCDGFWGQGLRSRRYSG